MIDFSKLNLTEAMTPNEQSSSDAAKVSSEKQHNPNRRQRQKDQMASKMGPTTKSDVVYASEEYFAELNRRVELHKMQEAAKSDWRKDLQEGRPPKENPEGNHPYVSIMPHTNSKAKEVKKKYKDNEEKEKNGLTVEEGLIIEKAKSKAQQRFMGAVYATQKGYNKNPTPEVEKAASTMKKSDAKEFASTKHKGLPEKKHTEETVEFEDIIGQLFEADRLMTGDEFHAKMKEKNKAPINPYPVVAKPKAPQSRKPQPQSTKSPEQRMADAYASPRKGPGGQRRAD